MTTTDRSLLRFIEDLARLDPDEVIGLARLLKVPVLEPFEGRAIKDVPARDGADILEDVIVAYGLSNHETRRQIDKLMKITLKQKAKREKGHGTSAKD